jgi:6-phosphogluconolactonase
MKAIEVTSRRSFIRSSVSLAFLHSGLGSAAASVGVGQPATERAYVGTYTGAPGSGSNGEGIYTFDVNARTGELSQCRLVAKTENPSWIVIHPSKKYLYAVNEISKYHGKNGSVSAYAISSFNGDLRPLNVVSSEGAGPAYIGIDSSGKYAFVANYGSGSIAVLSILEDGSLGAATDVKHDTGSIGNPVAKDAPPGSFAVSGHDSPHVHMAAVAPGNEFVLATDLGQDRIYSFRFDSKLGILTASPDVPFATLPSGDGPRHFVFHPDGRWLYSIQEESSTIVVFRYDTLTGSLTALQTVSTLPSGFAGTSFASEILISPNGKFLYGANRLHDSVAVFAIHKDGTLTRMGETSTRGDYPGQCRIDPGGNFFYACNRRSDSITSFKIHPANGLLSFTGQYTGVGSPASIAFL